ncbi:MAG TPA: hypothetical protein VKS22_13385 [Candidatus Binataceae bacterium]|nr:hypothetical protein [Candidatus Binataceae bacterium]
MSKPAWRNGRKLAQFCRRAMAAICLLTLGCAANHPEQTWPPRLELTCEHPEIIGETAAVYASMSNLKGGPYIVNSPYAIDASGARIEGWDVDTAVRRAGGREKLLDGLSEMPSQADASAAVTANVTAVAGGSLGALLPAVPFVVYRGARDDFTDLRIELGTFCHAYARDGGKLGCPLQAESDETIKGYAFLPAAKYDQLRVDVNDPNSVARTVTATCSIN